MSAGSSYLCVAAIDFGSTYSSYAFSMRHEFDDNPTKITTCNWDPGEEGKVSEKAPTCVLFNNRQQFHSFGYQAEKEYALQAGENKAQEWYFFKRFKMQLYKQKNIKRTLKLKDVNNREMNAMTVFAECIRYLKKHLMADCRSVLRDDDVRWVITVPAIWTDSAKQFMREAAHQAGFKSGHLIVALEPEAASLFCKHLPVEKMVVGDQPGFSVFQPGSKYVVFDAGGGTVDVTVHEVQFDGNLREIHCANGGDWGGTNVDLAFKALICELFGPNVFEAFTKQNPGEAMELEREFELKKRTIKPTMKDTEQITFRVPAALVETYESLHPGTSLQNKISSNRKFTGKVIVEADKVRLQFSLIKAMYNVPIENVKQHMRNLMRQPTLHDVPTILMVGGFSESTMLQGAIKDMFKNKRVVIPHEAGLTVLKGAVIFGHQPDVIKFRVSKYTYGIGMNKPFDPSVHKAEKKIQTDDGEELCPDVFDTHVVISDTVEVGEAQKEHSYTVIEKDQTRINFPLFTSSQKSPKYTDDNDCEYIGKLEIDVPGYGLGRSATVFMTFGGTELEVTAIEDKSQKSTSAKFDCLD